MKFAGRLEEEMFEAFDAEMKDMINGESWSNAAELEKIVDDLQGKYTKYFDLFFQPEFKDMSREEFLACMHKRH